MLETQWTRSRLLRLSRAISHPRENTVNSLAQVCGPGCSFKDICEYDIAGVMPVGERCPIEIRNSRILLKHYMEALADRLGADVVDLQNDMITYNLVVGIVEADIVTNRLNSIIAKDGLVQEDPAALDPNTGRMWYKDEESVAVKMKDRINKRKDSLFEQLIATPEMQAKYRKSKGDDAVAKLADIISRIEDKIDSWQGDPIEAEVIKVGDE